MIFDRLGEEVRPGTLGNIKLGEWQYPTSPSVKQHTICSDPVSADPIRPLPSAPDLSDRRATGWGGRRVGDELQRVAAGVLDERLRLACGFGVFESLTKW